MKNFARLVIASLTIVALTGPAAADDAAPTDTPAPAGTFTPATVQDGASPVNDIGGLSTGSNAASGSALQPNAASSLQGSNQDSSTLSAPTQQPGLSGAAPSDSQLQVLNGEADGQQYDPNDNGAGWHWTGLLLALLVAAGAGWYVRRSGWWPSRRHRHRRHGAAVPPAAEPVEPAEPIESAKAAEPPAEP